ncbi:MAG: FAD-binding oxidoreductase, partial [Actinomycetota bacterium]|nr:FAD-binding oxidoreductase [Actinomycetota bacterium]
MPGENGAFELDGFGGELIHPGDRHYDEARKVFNGMIDKHPAVIARCASTEDVVAAVNLAREEGLVVAVRSGGHSVAGMSICDDGVLIDLSGMKQIDVDADSPTARAGGGVLWGEFDAATQEHGLHTPGGRVTTTGVGGFTTGGGYGWTSSKYGLTCDNLISAEVVTADGEVLTASADENADLFWGIEGGACNFGVVTNFEFKLHPLGPMVFAGLAAWPVERAPEVIRAWRDYVDDAPDELSTGMVILTGPPEDFVPDHMKGQPIVGLAGMYVGDADDGAAAFQPLKDLEPDMDLIGPMPYTAFQGLLDPGNQPGFRNYWRGEYLTELSDEAIETHVERAREPLSPFNQIIIFRIGQAVKAVGDEDSAFSHRDADYMVHPIGMWEDPADDERMIGWVREFSEAMRPFETGGVYLNFTPDPGKIRD